MQSSFMGSLMELSEVHNDIMYLTADSGEGGLDLLYKRNFPDRCFNFGIAEENMVAAAAGMALCGKKPFVYTAAPFLVYRAFEFIRDDICLQNVPVKLIGSGSGISVSSLGPTHHTTEDIAVLRSLPNLSIFSPATPKQAYESIKEAYNTPGPVYIRLGMSKESEFFDEDYKIPEGGIDIIREGADALVVTTGAELKEVIDAAAILHSENIEITVASVFSVKPFDSVQFLKYARSARRIFTVEEHNVIGGLGSTIAECLYFEGLNIQMEKIGLKDCFTKGYGSLERLKHWNGLDSETIVTSIRRSLR
ncbi:transketolase family protein [Butyrivibrio sp. XPD2002]|uniref:transketolase family protein n=1 Tax=Butyrivibrio sp. XPD2002 TaxID=1280665 RepID=UPI0003FA3FD5|nr:transketolase C-terminal domain-containing protein [Butyrivibrio sp. XPD2002]